MINIKELKEQMDDYGFSSTYYVHLLSKNKQTIDKDKILKSMNKLLGNTQFLSTDDNEKSNGFVINGFTHTEFQSSNCLMPQTLLIDNGSLEKGDKSCFQVDDMTLSQTWDFPEGKELALQCKHSITLFIILGGALDYKDRIKVFQKSLAACLESIQCDVIFHKTINRLISPKNFLEDLSSGNPLAGALNVRFFNINYTNGESDMLVDTCGLAIIGLPDLQCFFNDKEPNEMAGYLYNMGNYIFEKGDIIKDGETTGRTKEERWVCTHEYASVDPHRVVLNIDTR